MLGYLWRQWRTVGATVASPSPARAVVDPEALILMSLWMLEWERRLADVVSSWVTISSPFLSIQRLGNLRATYPPVVGRRLSALAEVRTLEAKDPRWKSLRTDEPESLGGRRDKTRAVAPRLTSWATLMLQLRLGLGVGVKADVVSFLLGLNPRTPEWASVAMIADALGYTPTAVRRAADDLAGARFIRSLDPPDSAHAKQRMFSGLAGPWGTLLGHNAEQPGWGYWPERHRFVIDALTWLDHVGSQGVGQYVLDVGARDLLTRHGVTLRRDRIVDPLEFSVGELNLSYLASTVTALVDWLGSDG